MEEPPKVERIVSSRGVSIADAASMLKSFLSKIDQYDDNHHYYERENNVHDEDLFYNVVADAAATTTPPSTSTTPRYENGSKSPTRKSWEEREEEALIAQMDKLANANNNSTSGISDDVLERLRMITKSICAEVDGKHLSASGMLMNASVTAASSTREEDHDVDAVMHYFNEGQQHETNNYFSVKSEDPIDDSWEQQHPPQHPHIAEIEVAKTKKDKKKEKKAKKAAKKARKEAKRQRIK
jgi:hypothetical protein